jgi:CHRD domain-containing protein
VGPLQGKQLNNVGSSMQNGTAYVNVYIEQNPQGEIRGTVLLDYDAFEVGDDNGGG